jgi:hypothetical protein
MSPRRDGVEILEHLRNHTILLQDAGLHFILHDNFRNHRDATRIPSEQSQHRHVVDFRVGTQFQLQIRAKHIELATDVAAASWQQEPDLIQIVRESKELLPGSWWPHQANTLVCNSPATPGLLRLSRHGPIGQD